MSGEFDFPCPRCQVGSCQRSHAPYLRVYEGMLISVPDMPIWRCDFCGYHEFEQESISWLDTQLKQGSRRKAAKVKPVESRTTRRPKP